MDSPKDRPSRFFNYLISNRQRSIALSSQLIQPLISTDAISTLKNVVPGVSITSDGRPATDRLLSIVDSTSRFREVVLTSVPLVAADLLVIATSYLAGTLFTDVFFGAHYYAGLWYNLFAVCVCHLIVGNFFGLFPASGMNPVRELRAQISSISISFVLLIALNGLVGQVTRNEVLTILMALPITIAIAPPARFFTRKIAARYQWWGEKVIIVGMSQQALSIYKFLEHMPQRGLKPIGIVVENLSEYWQSESGGDVEFLGTTDELVSICRRQHCHWVIAAVADMEEADVGQILSKASLIPNLIVVSSKHSMPTLWVESFDAAGLAGMHIRDRLLFPFQRFSKRIADIVLSSILIVLLLPVMLIVAVLIRIQSKGDLLYSHKRIGRCGRDFKALKIRSMVAGAAEILQDYLNKNPEAKAEWEKDQKLKHDPRVIPGIGHFLRKTSLDELPQLWNVLRGDMSLVGPRPIVENEAQKYCQMFPLYLRVRPGLTGLWQVSGRNNTTYEDRVRLDSYYVRNWSMWLDYFILLRTVRTVLFREGSY